MNVHVGKEFELVLIGIRFQGKPSNVYSRSSQPQASEHSCIYEWRLPAPSLRNRSPGCDLDFTSVRLSLVQVYIHRLRHADITNGHGILKDTKPTPR